MRVRGAEEAERHSVGLVPHTQIERQVLGDFDIVLKEIILVGLPRVKTGGVDRLREGCGLVVDEILQIVEPISPLGIEGGDIEKAVTANVGAPLQRVAAPQVRRNILPLERVLDTALRKIAQAADVERPGNCGARRLRIVLRKIEVPAHKRKAELVDEPGTENSFPNSVLLTKSGWFRLSICRR